jgi:hypothetical protein
LRRFTAADEQQLLEHKAAVTRKNTKKAYQTYITKFLVGPFSSSCCFQTSLLRTLLWIVWCPRSSVKITTGEKGRQKR